MFGAHAGRDLFHGSEFEDLVAHGEGLGCERLGGDRDAEFVAGPQRAQILGFALGNRDDKIPGAEKIGELEAGGRECFLVGFVADRKRAGEIDDARGIGVGEADGARVGERHEQREAGGSGKAGARTIFLATGSQPEGADFRRGSVGVANRVLLHDPQLF